MSKKKVNNPLIKRIPRELMGDFKKYLSVFIFLTLTIGFVSGMYVANTSMMAAIDDMVISCIQEDGHFELSKKADADLIDKIESGEKADVGLWDTTDSDFQVTPVKLYENFFRNEDEDLDGDDQADGTVRAFMQTDDINLASFLDGQAPANAHEIAIDRMHADNVGLSVGDTIVVGGQKYTISGLLAYVNFSTLHEKNSDIMFDAISFDVAMVTKEGWDRLSGDIHYSYAWKYDKAVTDDSQQKSKSDNFKTALVSQVMASGNSIEDYLPGYLNNAMNFAVEDMGSDEAMGGVLLDIFIVIIAFIFAITISNTIAREASAIGTLRASGYTKAELTAHYMSMPLIVTILAALVGNILGYTVFKDVVVSMYYNSYSLPAYKTLPNTDAFINTTVIPFILMFVVNLLVITLMMQHSPLQFIRHDLKKSKSKKAMPLPAIGFIGRFRLRVVLQNISSYIILFVGICFIMMLLAFDVGMPDTLAYYQDNVEDMMISKYQYVLKSYKTSTGELVSTGDMSAEKYDMSSLIYKTSQLEEEVSVYGVSKNSRYITLAGLDNVKKGHAVISKSFADKYKLAVGDNIRLSAQYEKKDYDFIVDDIYLDCQSIAIFMPIDIYADIFDLQEDQFSGYFSDNKLEDIDKDLLARTITKKDITKMADQLDHSMGSYMTYFQVVCVLLAMVLIYLLTKLIIEKNENAISMTKILGYTPGEIGSIYLVSTTIVVVISDIISIFIGVKLIELAWSFMLLQYSGWFAFHVNTLSYVKMFVLLLVGYLMVMIFDFARIKKVPMDQALKNVE